MTYFSNYGKPRHAGVELLPCETTNCKDRPSLLPGYKGKENCTRYNAAAFATTETPLDQISSAQDADQMSGPTIRADSHGTTSSHGDVQCSAAESKPYEHLNNATEAIMKESANQVPNCGSSVPEALMVLPHENPCELGRTDVYVDGSFRAKRNGHDHGGIGVYFGKHDARNISESLVLRAIDNDKFEFLAVLRALQCSKNCQNVTIWSDSQSVIDTLPKACNNMQAASRKGKSGRMHKHHDIALQCSEIVEWRSSCGYTTQLQWVKGHNGNPGNVAADKLAGQASSRFISSGTETIESGKDYAAFGSTENDIDSHSNAFKEAEAKKCMLLEEIQSDIITLGERVVKATVAVDAMKQEVGLFGARMTQSRVAVDECEMDKRELCTRNKHREQTSLDCREQYTHKVDDSIKLIGVDCASRTYDVTLACRKQQSADEKGGEGEEEQSQSVRSWKADSKITSTVERNKEVESWTNALAGLHNGSNPSSFASFPCSDPAPGTEENVAFAEALVM